MSNVNNIKKDFPIFQVHPSLVYLDSAATSQKPQSVIDSISNYYTSSNANVHRGIYKLSENATTQYEGAREKIKNFINSKNTREIIFTRNATEAINLIAQTWGTLHLDNDNTILISPMEHHSNIIPWQNMCGLKSSQKVELASSIQTIQMDDNFRLDLDDLKNKLLNNKVALVAVTHASNTLGTINPIKKIIQLAHEHGAFVLVDGAQAAPHIKIDVQDLDADFYVFSGHKMLGPTGIGILYAKEYILKSLPPYQSGGEMISQVNFNSSKWNDLPWKFEAGTPNIAGAIGLGNAIDYLNKIGLENIIKHEQELGAYTLDKLNNVKELTILGPKDMSNRVSAFSFTFDGFHPHDIAQVLDEENIAVRAGHHCTMPLHTEILKIPASTRASFYLYNTKEDTDKLIAGLEKAKQTLK